ncbi:MAG: hypothetical protein N2255_10930 [Kiritimatiellae bacterium]|nr:hypothetical protein [Kiritimatiellia bacterium]
MTDKRTFDFWYAVNNTEIVLLPARHLETFGTTMLNYHLVSELMDTVGRVRVREGRILASRPEIITPEAYSRTILEGFGEEARQYIEWLKQHEREIRILQYGYKLKQESFNEHVVTGSIDVVLEQVRNHVAQRDDPLAAIVKGVDDPWDVCLVKLFWEVIQKSASTNIRELERCGMFQYDHGVPRGVRQEIERAFEAAARNPALIPMLGHKLQEHCLFEEYQDRFFSLVRSARRR